jgi:hypothetical protein
MPKSFLLICELLVGEPDKLKPRSHSVPGKDGHLPPMCLNQEFESIDKANCEKLILIEN